MSLVLSGSGSITGLSDYQAGSGLTLITKSTFSASASVSINNCFTSAYENYHVRIKILPSVAQEIQFRWRAGGADFTTGEYNYQGMRYANASAYNGDNTTFAIISTADATRETHIGLDLDSPALSNLSRGRGFSVGAVSGTGYNLPIVTGFSLKTTSRVEDGFTLYPSTGTFTGTIRVYGYRNG